MTRPNDPSRLCTATAKSTGRQCGNPAIPGGRVCARSHGGSAPQVKQAAEVRLRHLTDPALAVLADILEDPDAGERDKLRAVEIVLDRAGYPRRPTVEPVDPEELAARIAELADELE